MQPFCSKGSPRQKVTRKGTTRRVEEEKTVLSPAYGAIRTESHKYVEYDNGEKELYDLQADPYELDNVYESADPSLLEDLKAKHLFRALLSGGMREVSFERIESARA